MTKSISVDEKVSEFKLFRYHESFYFRDEKAMKPIQE
jgi:hypothetical protein